MDDEALARALEPLIRFIADNIETIERAVNDYTAWGVEAAEQHANSVTPQ